LYCLIIKHSKNFGVTKSSVKIDRKACCGGFLVHGTEESEYISVEITGIILFNVELNRLYSS